MKMTTKIIALFVMMGSATAFGGVCATAYQADHYEGHAIEIMDHEGVENLSDYALDYHSSWNNRISSIVVEPNCRLKVYQYENYGIHYHTGHRIGDRHTYKNYSSHHRKYFQLRYLNNKISSLKCFCR